MKTDLSALIRELKRVKAKYNLMTIHTIIEDIPIDELAALAHEKKLKVTEWSDLFHTLYTPERGIDISIFSKKEQPA